MIYSTSLALSAALALSSAVQGYVIKIDNHDGPLKNHDVKSNMTAQEFLASREPVTFHKTRKEKRQGEGGCFTSTNYNYQINGDGDPHQNYKIAQIKSTTVSCPGSVSQGESHTFGWSIGGGFNPGSEEYDFASVGFSVGESDTQTVTDTFTCTTGPSDICAMHYTAVTAVSVNFYSVTEDCDVQSTQNLGPGVVYLPNAGGVGSTIARGASFQDKDIIQCRGQDEREVDFFCGPKGGPEWFDNNTPGPWTDAYMAALDPAGCTVPIEAMRFADP